MTYLYEVIRNGVTTKEVESQFKPNIIAEIVKDLDLINSKTQEIAFLVRKKV